MVIIFYESMDKCEDNISNVLYNLPHILCINMDNNHKLSPFVNHGI